APRVWRGEQERPWALGAIVAAEWVGLKTALLDRLVAGHYRRGWLVVGTDRGWWREERLCLRRGGTWSFVADGKNGEPEPRHPARPELIPAFEAEARAAIAREGVVEGTLRVSRRGLLLIGADVDARTTYGIAADPRVLEIFWRIRLSSMQLSRLARGTSPA